MEFQRDSSEHKEKEFLYQIVFQILIIILKMLFWGKQTVCSQQDLTHQSK